MNTDLPLKNEDIKDFSQLCSSLLSLVYAKTPMGYQQMLSVLAGVPQKQYAVIGTMLDCPDKIGGRSISHRSHEP